MERAMHIHESGDGMERRDRMPSSKRRRGERERGRDARTSKEVKYAPGAQARSAVTANVYGKVIVMAPLSGSLVLGRIPLSGTREKDLSRDRSFSQSTGISEVFHSNLFFSFFFRHFKTDLN